MKTPLMNKDRLRLKDNGRKTQMYRLMWQTKHISLSSLFLAPLSKTIHISLLSFVLILCSCNDSSNAYSNQLKEEEKLIQSFIRRQSITVVDTQPEVWNEKTYWQVPDYDNFYFCLTNPGDTTKAPVETNDIILLRYIQYTLDAYADTIRLWNTIDNPYATQIRYWTSDDNACTGWQLAIKYMQYPGAQCKIICPSKLGFTTQSNNVTPYGYDMKIQIKR